MTKNAKKLLDFLRKYIEKNKISPNYEEMKEHMGLKSKSSIFQYLEYLEEQGHIKKDKYWQIATLKRASVCEWDGLPAADRGKTDHNCGQS